MYLLNRLYLQGYFKKSIMIKLMWLKKISDFEGRGHNSQNTAHPSVVRNWLSSELDMKVSFTNY